MTTFLLLIAVYFLLGVCAIARQKVSNKINWCGFFFIILVPFIGGFGNYFLG